MKSAQASQIFIYIMSGIIIIAVLGFGARSIFNLVQTAEEVGCIGFKNDLENRIAADIGYGVVDDKPIKVGCNYKEICFIDLESSPPAGFDNSHPVIYDSWSGGARQNIFLRNTIAEEFMHVDSLSARNEHTGEPFVCSDIKSGTAKLKFKGRGDSVLVTIP